MLIISLDSEHSVNFTLLISFDFVQYILGGLALRKSDLAARTYDYRYHRDFERSHKCSFSIGQGRATYSCTLWRS